MKENLKRYFFPAVLGFVILLYLYRKSTQSIINFPCWINLTLFLAAFCVVAAWGIGYVQKKQENIKENATKFMYAVYGIILASLLFFLIKIPVNYYIIQSSRNSSPEVIKCPLTYYSKSLKKQSKYITYQWNGKKYRLNIDADTRKKLRDNPTAIILYVRKGALNTRVIDKYELDLQ
ncbi:MAG: hypothetical protein IPM95_15865 [Sphingobacteriales bacterium]|jgi:uncharacterized membrane protein|nr:hypothetical protein [Sphingobacteriales bacterium]